MYIYLSIFGKMVRNMCSITTKPRVTPAFFFFFNTWFSSRGWCLNNCKGHPQVELLFFWIAVVAKADRRAACWEQHFDHGVLPLQGVLGAFRAAIPTSRRAMRSSASAGWATGEAAFRHTLCLAVGYRQQGPGLESQLCERGVSSAQQAGGHH